jgi:hypothetical protein
MAMKQKHVDDGSLLPPPFLSAFLIENGEGSLNFKRHKVEGKIL